MYNVLQAIDDLKTKAKSMGHRARSTGQRSEEMYYVL